MIDEITIQKIKDAANVVDVIGDFYSLKRDGVNFTCLCPFHADHSLGSFKISESKNIYTCYSCGKHGGPVDFLMEHEGLSFVDAIKWLGAKYGIEVEDSDKWKERVKQCKPHAPTPPLPMLVMPAEWVKAKQVFATKQKNTFVEWLSSLPWSDEQRKRVPIMLNNYQVGHSPQEGHTIFWQIDEEQRVRTGKMMKYKPDGHRDKESPHNFDFIHSVMFRAHRLDPMEVQAQTCFFGQHLINAAPKANINIVESEKTALICAIAYGNMKHNIWIASGGLNNINKQKLEPFIKARRTIVLYPDHDGIEAWKEKAKAINYNKLHVNTDYVTTWWHEEDGEKADIADVLLRHLRPNKSTLDKLSEQYEVVDELRKQFDLEIVK